MKQHALLVKIRFSDDEFGSPEERDLVYEIEDQLLAVFSGSGTGECDGHEFGGGWGVVFCYGQNAEELFASAAPIILRYDLPMGSHVVKREGGPGATESVLLLSPGCASH